MTISGPATSSERPATASAAAAARTRHSITSRSSTGAVRCSPQAGITSTGMRSTSRTRKRNERERAPITIDARSATEFGDRLEQDAFDRQAAGEMIGEGGCRSRDRRLGHEAAEVDDPRRPRPPWQPRRSSPPLGARARRSASPAPAPSNGSGSRQRRRPRSASDSPTPETASPVTSLTPGGQASASAAFASASSAPRTSWPAVSSRARAGCRSRR